MENDYEFARRMLIWSGREDFVAEAVLASLRRLASASRNRWPWMRRFTLPELVQYAVVELLMSPLTSTVEDAWASTASWAYQMADLDSRTMQPPLPLGDDLDVEEPAPYREGGEAVDYACLSPQQQEIVAMSLSGMTWGEMARLLGRHPTGIVYSYRRAVKRLLDHNPELPERFGLIPCPAHDSDLGWCRPCRGFGWTWEDGRPLSDRGGDT